MLRCMNVGTLYVVITAQVTYRQQSKLYVPYTDGQLGLISGTSLGFIFHFQMMHVTTR